jgi:hypothetical protein
MKFVQDVRTEWQPVRMLPSVPEYSEFPFTNVEMSDSEDRSDARPSRLTWSYYGKNRAILERQS